MDSGQVSDRDRRIMAVLADTPFADADEVEVFAALQARGVRESLAWCRRNKLADYIEYSRSSAARTRRWFLTGQGIEALSESEGVTLARLLRDKPVSVEWQRSLLRRLDTLDLFYRLLSMVARIDGAMPEWVWYRTSVYDAALRLRSNGKAFVLMRFVGAVLRGMRNENPLFVSSMDVLREQGIFGNAWLFPWNLDLGRVQFAMFRGGRRWS